MNEETQEASDVKMSYTLKRTFSRKKLMKHPLYQECLNFWASPIGMKIIKESR